MRWDALGSLWQVQLAAFQEANQAGQHVRGRKVDVLNQKPPALAHRLYLHQTDAMKDVPTGLLFLADVGDSLML